MIAQEFIIPNSLGLHIRAVSKLSHLAARYQASIHISLLHKKADVKSIFRLLTLGAKQGDTVTIHIEGPDEEEAYHAIKTLIDNHFDEKEQK